MRLQNLLTKVNAMAWTVHYNPDYHIMEVIYKGRTTGQDFMDAGRKRVSISKEIKTNKVLIDAIEIQLAGSLFDIYDVPDKLYLKESADRRDIIALVAPDSNEAITIAKFYRTVCQNRSWIVEVFTDRKSAIDWLLGNENSANIDNNSH